MGWTHPQGRAHDRRQCAVVAHRLRSKGRGLARGQQEGAGIERDDVVLGPLTLSGENIAQPRGILLGAAALPAESPITARDAQHGIQLEEGERRGRIIEFRTVMTGELFNPLA